MKDHVNEKTHLYSKVNKIRRNSSIYHSTMENIRNVKPVEDVDEIITELGFGPWQILSLLTVFCIQSSYSSQHLATVFTNMPLDFKCLSNINNSNNITYDNACYNSYITNLSSNTTMKSCKIYEYDTTMFQSTFTSEFNLVCDKAWLSNLYKSMGFLGVIIGCAFTGLSDKWGRVIVIRLVTVLYVTCALLVGLSTNVYIIIVSRFFIGFCYEMINGSAFTLMMEILPRQYRTPIAAILSNIANTTFTMVTGGVSYFIRDWRILHLVLSTPIFLLGVVVLFLDKSPRWLILNNKTIDGLDILEKAAKINKSKMPDREKVIALAKGYTFLASVEKHNTCCQKMYSKCSTIKALFGTPSMRIITLIFPIVSLFTANVYYTIPLNANNITDNPFLYMIAIGIAEFPPNLFAPYLIKKLGNLNTSCLTYSVTMICLVVLVFVPASLMWVQWSFVIIAMMMIEVNYMVCYVMSSELFPTIVRSAGYGINAFAKHSGVLMASNIVDLAAVGNMPWLPNAISASCCLLVALMIRFLPETQGKCLCDTVEDVEKRKLGLKSKLMKYEQV